LKSKEGLLIISGFWKTVFPNKTASGSSHKEMLTLWALSSPGLVFSSLYILGLPNLFYAIGK
jgi:hypothetical protein